jgi:hypothetical protein
MISKTTMLCPDVEKKLVFYLEDLVAPGERRLIEQHLAGCSGCWERLAELEATRQSAAQALQSLAANAEPSQQAWRQLQTRLAGEAHPLPSKTTAWKQRPAQRAYHTSMHTFQGANIMHKRFKVPTLAAVVVMAIIGIFLTRNATPVSAQQILERATVAQSTAAQAVGIRHIKVETYRNPQAPNGDQAGTKTISESYYDLTMGYMRSTSIDSAGKLVNAFAYDGSYTYSPGPSELGITGNPTIYRVPQTRLSKDLLVSEDYTVAARADFDEFRNNSNVEFEGKQTWTDGKSVYILVNRNVPTSKLPGGKESDGPTGTEKMIFDAQTYKLLENQTTIYHDGKDIVILDVRFLADEVLPAGTPVSWNLSDLKGVTFVDDPNAEHGETLPEVISEHELAAHTVSYVLKTIPTGFTMEITADPHQPNDQLYAYVITYRSSAGENFVMQSSAEMPVSFVETNFNDGSYTTAAGLVLHFSAESPDGGTPFISALLTASDGTTILIDSNLPRERVEALAEELVQAK